MNSFRLVLAFIARNPLTWAFNVVMLSIGVAIVLSVVLTGRAIDDRLTRDLAGVDLVVGAKGSPTQLILSTLFATDVPTGNIDLTVADKVMANPLVREAVTLSLGDNVSGFRIVGTQPMLAEFYQAKLATGAWWTKPYEVVLGADAAKGLKARLGSSFIGEHGLTEGGERHEATPYNVVGILKPTGAAIDRMVLTDRQSVWDIHAEAHPESKGEQDTDGKNAIEHGHDHDHEQSADKEVTAVLVRYRSAMGALMMPRQIDALPDIQGAVPAREAARLAALTGTGTQVLQGMGLSLLALAALGFCIALGNAVHQRRSELALLRVLGIAPFALVRIILLEAAILGAIAGILGVAIGRALFWVGSQVLANDGGVRLTALQFGLIDGVTLLCAVVLALGAALIPARLAYKIDPAFALKGNVG